MGDLSPTEAPREAADRGILDDSCHLLETAYAPLGRGYTLR